MERETPRWVRLGVIITLAVPQLATGVWALVAPKSWFQSFPGFGARLVAAEPPYNQHLASDVGAGFLATGIALLVAAIWARRAPVLLALVTFIAFSLPHVIFHVSHPADALTGAEDTFNVLVLATGVVLAVVFIWGARGAERRRPTERVSAIEPAPVSRS